MRISTGLGFLLTSSGSPVDICLKEVPSIADSLYNIQLLREFSNEFLNRAYYLRPEDLPYAPP